MRSFFALATVAWVASFTSAFAYGGMGDPSTVLKEKNAICEAQKRGEGPLYPNMCLPELPVDDRLPGHARRK
jgi:hypothetical protein